MAIVNGTGRPFVYGNIGEFFASKMNPIEIGPQFVRITFCSTQHTLSIMLTQAAFTKLITTALAYSDRMLN